MRLRRRMDEAFARGVEDGSHHRRPDPSRYEGASGRFLEWAYTAGFQEGRAAVRVEPRQPARPHRNTGG